MNELKESLLSPLLARLLGYALGGSVVAWVSIQFPANRDTVLIHIFFWVCVAIFLVSIYYWIRQLRGKPLLDRSGAPVPSWVLVTFAGVGALGVAASAPGLFFEQPYWLTDKLFGVVQALIEIAT